MATNMDKTYAAYWRRHPDEHKRLEMTIFWAKHYDYAVDRQDWRCLMALERWAKVFGMPLLAGKARRSARQIMPKKELQILEVLQCER